MSVKLLVDPSSRRVVYLSANGVLPERVFILDGEQQHLFRPASCELEEFGGELPRGLNPQNCWQYSLAAPGRLERR